MNDKTRDEREKWEAYYATVSAEDVLRDGAEVYAELASAMIPLIPPRGRVLEAACGSGRLSAELARSMGCTPALLDFSPNAIACARRVFDRVGASGEFLVGDMFSFNGRGQFDLVFNSGVLEHYSFAGQVEFLAAMARQSRRYVLVLVPNRECHWYWIYRLQRAAGAEWPFGYEKPASSYRRAIAAAGLHYLGRAYFGATAVTWFVEHTHGLAPELRDLVISMHRREVVSPSQRSYLVGFLAAVQPEDASPAPFACDDGEDPLLGDWPDRCVALAADALAIEIATRQEVDRLKRENALLGERLAAMSSVQAQ